MPIYQFILGAIAAWRITHLLAFEEGPGALLESLRRRIKPGFWGKVFECFYCLSLWVAAPIALLIAQGWRERAILWPALSGGAILVERFNAGAPAMAPSYYTEDAAPENPDVETQAEEQDVLR
ncbi:MAG TPA: hypothetical protein VKS22_02610 [Candidatus Binataceae bacterium]|nr:hypothetical protein [Candidatus Binataceae bacterium]